MDLDALVTTAVGLITAGVGGTFSWFTAKKKYKAEVEDANITNMKNSLEFYIQLSEDNRKQLEAQQEENAKLREENKILKERLDASEDKLREMQNMYEEMELKIVKLEKTISDLTKKKNGTKASKKVEKA